MLFRILAPMLFLIKLLISLQIVFVSLDTTRTSVERADKMFMTTAPSDTLILRQIPNHAFRLGEQLDYSVKFGSVSAGYARLSIPKQDTVNSRVCYQVVSQMWTNAFFSNFFKVDDLVETFIDIHGIFPWKYHKRIREGKYKSNRSAVFDHVRGLAFERKEVIPITPFTQDMLSIFYYLRTLDLKAGQTLYIDSYADRKFYPLEVKIIKKEKIHVPAGKFECFLVEPAMRAGSIFEQKGQMWVWFSTDKSHLPVMIKSKINIVGSLSMELTQITSISNE